MKKIICLLFFVAGIAMRGLCLVPGDAMGNAMNAGNYNSSGSYTDTKSNAAGSGYTNNYGQVSNDIWYSFTIGAGTNTVTLSLCGSSFDTYLHLLNSSGTEIAFNDDDSVPLACGGVASFMRMSNLAPGTYYVVAEGYSSYTGTIAFSLSVNIVVPVTISYAGPQTYNVGTAITALAPTISSGTVSAPGETGTFAGTGSAGSTDGSGTSASFNQPLGATVDPSGNIFIAEAGSHIIRKITPAGQVSIFAGNYSQGFVNNTTGTSASFYHPVGLASDASGNIYVADEDNNVIRLITPGGAVSTFAGNGSQGINTGAVTAATAMFKYPCGVAVDGSGNVYVADSFNNMIRKISGGMVTIFAGNISGTAGSADGQGTAAGFNQPFSVVTDAAGNVYVTDRQGAKIRKITPSGLVSTLAGSGTAGYLDATTSTTAQFNGPTGLAIDKAGNLYVTDEGNNRIRKVTPGGPVTTLSGTGVQGNANGAGNASTFNLPFGIAADAGGLIYVGDLTTNLIRKIVARPYTVSPALPAGLLLNNTTGVISGTPTAVTAQTAYTIKASNTVITGSAQLTMKVNNAGALNLNQDQNYIATYVPSTQGLTTDALVISASSDKTKEKIAIQYFDGLGRPLQTVQVKGGATGLKDVVQPAAYDAYGREAQKYLPYASPTADGSYKSSGISTEIGNFYNPGGNGLSGAQQTNGSGVVVNPNPFSITNFEPSPLNRVTEQGAPGNDWQPYNAGITNSGHTVKMAYLVNNVNTFSGADTAVSTLAALYRATINADQSRTLTRATGTAANYLAGQLHVTVTKDENWKSGRGGTTEEYKDNEGYVVLKRTFNYIPAQTSPVLPASLQMLSTYYVYDDQGNLAFVLPPGANPDAAGLPSAAALANFCYQYQYDSRNRLVQKKLPGKDWEYMIYNSLDKVIATQDGNQRLNNQWIFTKHDALGRVMVTGTWVTAITRPALQLQINQLTTPLWETRVTGGYPSNVSWPTNPSGTLTVSYYDDYTFGDFASFPAAWDNRPVSSKQTKGQLTCTKTWVLGSTAVLYKLFYYDDLGRQTLIYAQHYLYGTTGAASLGNYDKVFTTYNFDNQASVVYRYHFVAGAQALRVDNAYFYDHMGRKRQTYTAINNAASVLQSQQDYNESGQLIVKHLHSENGGAFLQSATYSYNERGWLLGSTTDGNLFNMNLYYNKPTDLSIYRPSYNGNISEFVYSKTSAANVAFKYNYDQLNRLTNSTSTGGSILGEQVSYDLMGNITGLTRTGPNAATLLYTYYNSNGSNQLQTVTNGGAAFRSYGTYDPNGNAPGDGGITAPKQISYNLFNLPQTVTQSGSTLATYTYDATANKLANKGSDGYWNYISGVVYNGTSVSNGTIKFVATEEGRAVPNGSGGYNFEYNLTDNLGNVRVSFAKNPSTGAALRIQENEYYPFGLKSSAGYDLSSNNRYLYNGKEEQTDLTSQYDYGARFYDPVIARWTVLDPLAEKGRRISPYVYVEGNPIRLIDPDGAFPVDITLRSFAPFNWFGGGFKGDGEHRGFSTSPNAPAKLNARVRVETDDNSIKSISGGSAISKGGFGLWSARSPTDVQASMYGNTLTMKSQSGNHAAIPFIDTKVGKWMNEEVDNNAKLNFALSNGKGGTQILNISGSITGDHFPAGEGFATDAKGNSVFLGASDAGSWSLNSTFAPYFGLAGHGDELMSTVNVSIVVDKNGVFTGVVGADGKTISIKEWNKTFEKRRTTPYSQSIGITIK